MQNFYISADEILSLVNDPPGCDADGDDVMTGLNQGVAERIADMSHDTLSLEQIKHYN